MKLALVDVARDLARCEHTLFDRAVLLVPPEAIEYRGKELAIQLCLVCGATRVTLGIAGQPGVPQQEWQVKFGVARVAAALEQKGEVVKGARASAARELLLAFAEWWSSWTDRTGEDYIPPAHVDAFLAAATMTCVCGHAYDVHDDAAGCTVKVPPPTEMAIQGYLESKCACESFHRQGGQS